MYREFIDMQADKITKEVNTSLVDILILKHLSLSMVISSGQISRSEIIGSKGMYKALDTYCQTAFQGDNNLYYQPTMNIIL